MERQVRQLLYNEATERTNAIKALEEQFQRRERRSHEAMRSLSERLQAALESMETRLAHLEQTASLSPGVVKEDKLPPLDPEHMGLLVAPTMDDSESGSDTGSDTYCTAAAVCSAPIEKLQERRKAFSVLDETFSFEESAWDASVFAFISPVSPLVSLNISIQLFVNIAIQGFFLFVVNLWMCNEPMSTDYLLSLLRFRVGVAHHVKYADNVHGMSLARQICQQDEKIPWAGMQFGLIGNLLEAKDGGKHLATLAVLCWLLTLIGELDATIRFASAVFSLQRKGPSVLKLSHEEARLESVSRLRVLLVSLFVVLPRLFICMSLAKVGIQFLVYTTAMSDLLLNALALEFIKNIDEMLYAAFAPVNLKQLFSRLDPVTYPPLARTSGLNACTRAIIAFCALTYVFYGMIFPFYAQMNVAFDILCSGEKDFVFGNNRGTSMAEIVRTFQRPVVSWTDQELAVLQVANLDLHRVFPGFVLPEAVRAAMASDVRTAELQLGPHDVKERLKKRGVALELTQLRPRMDLLADVNRLINQETAQQVAPFACADKALSTERNTTQQHLESITKGARTCEEAIPLCNLSNMTALRVTCPVSCGCNVLQGSPASYYAGPGYGCPRRCKYAVPAQDANLRVPCTDVPAERFSEDEGLRSYFRIGMQVLGSQGYTLLSILHHVEEHGQVLGVQGSAKERGIAHITGINNGSYAGEVTNGEWNLLLGQVHPRGLQGCSFWTSWEVKLMMGMDFCASHKWRSLRPYCPESCGCRTQHGDFCPPSCYPLLVNPAEL